LSSPWPGWLDAPVVPSKTGRRGGGSPRCASSACVMSLKDLLRALPLPAAPPSADLLGHGPVLGDDGLGLGGGDRGAVGVADHVGHAAVHDRPGALGQVRGDHAQRAQVVLATLDHLHPVEAGQLGVLAAGVVRGADQGGAQQPITGLAYRLALAVGLAGLRGLGCQAGEGPELGRGGEPAGRAVLG
jgi:hypothetical protein